MILANINETELYYSNNPYFKEAFEFLKNKELINLEPGKYQIEGDKVFASISSCVGKGKENAPLESHKKYIDIQYCIKGTDCIGIKPVCECKETLTEYNKEKDIEFFKDNAETYFLLQPKNFAIFFPSDAHAPLAGEGEILKVVVKVALA